MRLRGSDGSRLGVGTRGAAVDPAGPVLRAPLAAVVAAHARRRGGRVATFPGDAALTGTVPATPLRTRDFLRPRWHAGELVLDVQPAAGGTLVPFETPHPTPCCADHV